MLCCNKWSQNIISISQSEIPDTSAPTWFPPRGHSAVHPSPALDMPTMSLVDGRWRCTNVLVRRSFSPNIRKRVRDTLKVSFQAFEVQCPSIYDVELKWVGDKESVFVERDTWRSETTERIKLFRFPKETIPYHWHHWSIII